MQEENVCSKEAGQEGVWEHPAVCFVWGVHLRAGKKGWEVVLGAGKWFIIVGWGPSLQLHSLWAPLMCRSGWVCFFWRVCICVSVCVSWCAFEQECKHTWVCVFALESWLACHMLRHVLQRSRDWATWMPVNNTLKSNCRFVCMCVQLLPRQLAAASMPTHTPQHYLCICSSMWLNPFTSNLNLRAHCTQSRNMPYAPHSPIQHTHRRTPPPLPIIHIWPPLERGRFLHWCK